MSKMVILRGVSGSGKSTRARELVKQAEANNLKALVCSADMFFMDPNGNYVFDSKLLSKAHFWCKTRAELACELGVDLIIIDNTNTQLWEYEKYMNYANYHGYEVEEEVIGQLDEANLKVYANRNKHEVPLNMIRKQAKRFK